MPTAASLPTCQRRVESACDELRAALHRNFPIACEIRGRQGRRHASYDETRLASQVITATTNAPSSEAETCRWQARGFAASSE